MGICLSRDQRLSPVVCKNKIEPKSGRPRTDRYVTRLIVKRAE
jgi:hypothetical protein